MADLRTARHVHMVGIGGSGMSALATLLLGMGKTVSGSELSESATIRGLQAVGAIVADRHAAANVEGAEYVVRSSAVPDANPEVIEAARRGLPNVKLAQAVGELMREREGVAIAGTHGKTTTTALTTWLLERGGQDPLALIGADTPQFAAGARLGDGPMVVEADEYDRRFLSYWPKVGVVTSIEADHLDYFSDLSEITQAFQELVDRLPVDGRLVVCADDPTAASLSTAAQRDTYGFAPDATWRIDEYAAAPNGGSRFTLSVDGRAWSVQSSLVGMHNARNAVAAVAVADYFGVGLASSLAALPAFAGTRRRFETKGRPAGIWVVDDYAHHPTEIRATLAAAREVAQGSVWAVFQPHTANRTHALLDDFSRAFDASEHVLVLPIYRPSGREQDDLMIESSDIVERARRGGHPDARAVATFDDVCRQLAAEARPNDLVLTLGAGDVTRLSDMLVERL